MIDLINYLHHLRLSFKRLEDLFEELILCQRRETFLLEQIEEHLKQSNDQPNSSLQQAFQQRKSSFIRRSEERVKRIYSERKSSHQRIIPQIKLSENIYLQEKRQLEYDRLCAMIIKHQNRQSAKIYGNCVRNQCIFK